MRIEWLNGEMTEALVIKGWFRKRQARLLRTEYYGPVWKFAVSGNEAGGSLRRALESERRREERRREIDRDWQPVESLPSARLLRGKP